jgi:hypothetical protein
MHIVFNKSSVQPCYNDLFAHLSYNDLYDTGIFNVVVMLFFLIYFSKNLIPWEMHIFFNKPSVQPCYNDLFAHPSYNDFYDTRVF